MSDENIHRERNVPRDAEIDTSLSSLHTGLWRSSNLTIPCGVRVSYSRQLQSKNSKGEGRMISANQLTSSPANLELGLGGCGPRLDPTVDLHGHTNDTFLSE